MSKSCRTTLGGSSGGRAGRSVLRRLAGSLLVAATLAGPPAAAAASETTVGVVPGPLSVLSTADLSFEGSAGDGKEHALRSSQALDLSDATGSGSGWRTTLSTTQFDDGAGGGLPADSTSVDGAPDIACDAGSTCTPAETLVSYPLAVPGDGASTVTILNAKASTGVGNQTVSVPYRLYLPANADAGKYTSTWTVTLVSGP